MFKLTLALSIGALIQVPLTFATPVDPAEEQKTLFQFILEKPELQPYISLLKRFDLNVIRTEIENYFTVANEFCAQNGLMPSVFVGASAEIDRFVERYLGENVACQQALMKVAAANFVLKLKSPTPSLVSDASKNARNRSPRLSPESPVELTH